jgi:hypothetical protein
MLRPLIPLAALLISLLPLPCLAQHAEITVDSKPGPREIQSWLSSDDPRLVAWGAWFARETSDDGAATLMLLLVDRWTADERALADAETPQRDAMQQVLDALIQRQEQVSPAELSPLATIFPVQALILASRLPLAEATPLLLTWYGQRNEKADRSLARISAMLLSKDPPPGFAASVVEESEEQLFVIVLSLPGGMGWGGSSCCGGAIRRPAPSGWPPPFSYRLRENQTKSSDPVVAEAGGDRIIWQRVQENQEDGACPGISSLSSETRRHLILEMLGADGTALSWKTRENTSIVWSNKVDFLRQLKNLAEGEEARFRAVNQALETKRFLTQNEAETVRPRLLITLFDQRDSGEPLPQWVPRDSRTTIGLSPQ